MKYYDPYDVELAIRKIVRDCLEKSDSNALAATERRGAFLGETDARIVFIFNRGKQEVFNTNLNSAVALLKILLELRGEATDVDYKMLTSDERISDHVGDKNEGTKALHDIAERFGISVARYLLSLEELRSRK